MNLTTISTTELQNELEIREGVFYRGGYKHKKDCDGGYVNPITEWCGGNEVMITGHKCPKCGMITKV
jgi:hypothetical protein